MLQNSHDENFRWRISEQEQLTKMVGLKFDMCRELEYMHSLNSLLGISLPTSIIVKICYVCVTDPPELVRQRLYELAFESASYYVN